MNNVSSAADNVAAQGSMIAGMMLFAAILAAYFAPTIIALARRHPQQWAILAVDLFIGWTILGWVVALAWSLMRVDRPISDSLAAVAADAGAKTCPSCAEKVKMAAVKCRFCGHEFGPAQSEAIIETY
jgi:hypothetical protein